MGACCSAPLPQQPSSSSANAGAGAVAVVSGSPPASGWTQPTDEERRAAIGIDGEGGLTAASVAASLDASAGSKAPGREEEELQRCLQPDEAFFTRKPRPEPGQWLDQVNEPGQPFDEYARSEPHRPDAKRNTIYLLPLLRDSETPPGPGVGRNGGELPALDMLLQLVGVFFQCTVKALEPVRFGTMPSVVGGQQQPAAEEGVPLAVDQAASAPTVSGGLGRCSSCTHAVPGPPGAPPPPPPAGYKPPKPRKTVSLADASQQPVCADRILNEMEVHVPDDAHTLCAVTMADMYVEGERDDGYVSATTHRVL